MAKKKNIKIFVLDTSVILHDHQSFYNFEENYIAIPITVLEELDNFKKGADTKNFAAREFIRNIDKLSEGKNIEIWHPIPKTNGKFQVTFYSSDLEVDAEKIFLEQKADHRILNTVLHLKKQEKDKEVILVTKDINLRMKARGLQIKAEDYKNDKIVVENLDEGYTERQEIQSKDTIAKLYKEKFIDASELTFKPDVNNFYVLKDEEDNSCLAFYEQSSDQIRLVEKKYSYGIKPRNAEQTFAVDLLTNEEIKVVAIQGVAGTGKTLLALAAALEQSNQYNQVILARPIVPLSNKDIGFLPGDIQQKVNPFMEPLWDNLKVIKNQYKETEKKYRAIEKMQEEKKIVITALAYIRGRSFSDTYFIVDESQNLTPHEIKTIITRAGENTKIIFTGDIHQIDAPFLDDQSNGLSYLIDRFKGQPIFGHIKLKKGERSELADLANKLL